MSPRWWWRTALAVALAGGVIVGGDYAHLDPEPVRVVLLVAVGVLGLGVLLDGTVGEPAQWGEQRPRPSRSRGRDATTASYLRVVEDHLTARDPSAALRDRMARLADQALARRGLDRHAPEARDLLGPDLAAALGGPVQRMTRTRIERCVERIEQL